MVAVAPEVVPGSPLHRALWGVDPAASTVAPPAVEPGVVAVEPGVVVVETGVVVVEPGVVVALAAQGPPGPGPGPAEKESVVVVVPVAEVSCAEVAFAVPGHHATNHPSFVVACTTPPPLRPSVTVATVLGT